MEEQILSEEELMHLYEEWEEDYAEMQNENYERENVMNYVMHYCKNKKCNNGWVDKDLTNATTYPPQWKYCKECAKKLGIDFDAQTTNSNLTEEELKAKNEKIERLKKARQEKIKSKHANA